MPEVIYQGNAYQSQEGETVLKTLLRHQEPVSYSCQSGVCQACLMQASPDSEYADGTLFQSGLTEQQKQQGFFLACQTQLTSSLSINDESTALKTFTATVIDKKIYNSSIFSLVLSVDTDKANPSDRFIFHGGQFVNLVKSSDCIRSYSIASASNIDTAASDNTQQIEVHIKCYDQGEFSQWAFNDLNISDSIQIQSALGTCYYTQAQQNQPLQLFAMGTGLAPIIGVLKTALNHQHNRPIWLVAGAKQASDFYYLEELNAIAKKHSHVSVSYIAQHFSEEKTTDTNQPTLTSLRQQFNSIQFIEDDYYRYTTTPPDSNNNHSESKNDQSFNKDALFFICGSESFVSKLRKKCFLAGTNLTNIYADIFLAAK